MQTKKVLDIPQVIDGLKHLLETCSDDAILLETLKNKLKLLRTAFSSNRDVFTVERISFLKMCGDVHKQLRLFFEVKEEIELIENLEEYIDLRGQLVSTRDSLQGVAVCQRINREIRILEEKLPFIKEREQDKRQSKFNQRKYELEAKAPLCSKGHALVIRENGDDYFWGCSQYPLHRETRKLSQKQKEFLGN